MVAVPLVGGSKVTSIFITVLLPAPLGPSRPNTWPSLTASVRPSTAVRCENRFVSACVSMIHAGSVASREPFSARLGGLASLGEMLSDISCSFMRQVSQERLRNPSGSFRVGCGCAREKADHGDKERGADDGPDNRKLHFAEFQYEK